MRICAASLLLVGLMLATAASPAAAEGAGKDSDERPAADSSPEACLAELDRLGVAYRRTRRRGIDTGVLIQDNVIGGVTYRAYHAKPLVLDCSLVVSLARIGPYLRAHGVERATYSSSYQRRKVRGTDRWSKHSFGLAIDIHSFTGKSLGTITVKDDYEQGLGDGIDCVGDPLTRAGAILRTIDCQLTRSGQFYSVLTPDYDAAHYNHFHLEARPWNRRGDDWHPPDVSPQHPANID